MYRNLRSVRQAFERLRMSHTHTHTLARGPFTSLGDKTEENVFHSVNYTPFSGQMYREYDKLIWWIQCVQRKEKNNSIWHIAAVCSFASSFPLPHTAAAYTHTGGREFCDEASIQSTNKNKNEWTLCSRSDTLKLSSAFYIASACERAKIPIFAFIRFMKYSRKIERMCPSKTIHPEFSDL